MWNKVSERCACILVIVCRIGRGRQEVGRRLQASPGKPYRRFLGERFEASVGFDSTTRTKVQEDEGVRKGRMKGVRNRRKGRGVVR